jgi:hypothetical protein
MRSVVFSFALVAACGGTDAPPLPDADPNAPLCTGVVFDNCLTNDKCDSLNCKLFRQEAIQVCTQACDTANPCPNDASGTPASCNDKGLCKPSRANACRPE